MIGRVDREGGYVGLMEWVDRAGGYEGLMEWVDRCVNGVG